jgi:catechol 2,3-dioxygenase-like lactoylglutathione lyase family enzyme
MIQLIDHIAITVRDLQETIDFYAKLGFRLTQRNETPVQTIAFLEAGPARLEVFAPKKTTTPPELGQSDLGVKHIALMVDDVQKAFEEARAKGVVFNSELGAPLWGTSSPSSRTRMEYSSSSCRRGASSTS